MGVIVRIYNNIKFLQCLSDRLSWTGLAGYSGTGVALVVMKALVVMPISLKYTLLTLLSAYAMYCEQLCGPFILTVSEERKLQINISKPTFRIGLEYHRWYRIRLG